MENEWLVTVTFTDGMDVSYKFFGIEEEAEFDAYLSFPEGSVEEVLVQGPSHEDQVTTTSESKGCTS